MPRAPFSTSVHYNLSTNMQDALFFLADTLELPRLHVQNGNVTMLEAACGTILYRHLGRLQRIEVMELIRKLEDPRVRQALITKILDVTYVNPRWGIWSLSGAELKSEVEGNSKWQKFFTLIGVAGGKDVARNVYDVWKSRAISASNGYVLLGNFVI